jgi:hypothetical protein
MNKWHSYTRRNVVKKVANHRLEGGGERREAPTGPVGTANLRFLLREGFVLQMIVFLVTNKA